MLPRTVKSLDELVGVNVETRRLSELSQAGPGDEAIEIISEAPGVWRNGTRVRKCKSEPGDFHAVGVMATVTGSIGPLDGNVFGYFVRWDDVPGVPAFVVSLKLELAS